MAYLPDHAPKVAVSDALLGMLAGVDVLIHDAQFLDHERPRAEDYGHATISDAVALAIRVHAKRVVLFHHAPDRTDDALDAIAAETSREVAPGRAAWSPRRARRSTSAGRLRATDAIATAWHSAAAIVRAWKISWKPNTQAMGWAVVANTNAPTV